MPRYRVVVSRVLLTASVFGLALLHLLQPSYDPRTRTLSEYALSTSGWVFTLSMLSMASGSALVLSAVWNGWQRRRWLQLVWVAGLVVVAAVPTEPGGAVTTLAGAVHAAAATLAIFALLVAEVATAFTARGNRLLAGACARRCRRARSLAVIWVRHGRTSRCRRAHRVAVEHRR